ncbi:Mitochondrial inner membrane protease atp23 [Apophysomyces sp. BC1034]|nr:Mitochondrial inner membrane protease atp23 [Apophysomyces sp. BC1015]KAG0189310.1 Mitochondrial inner membrane protease atp23 [Apophysomyces sp. BC1034]
MADQGDINHSPSDNAPSLKDMKKFERWRKSLQYITGLGMNEDEKKQFRSQLQTEADDMQCRQCEVWKDNLMKNSPSVRFMLDHMQKVGKPLGKDDFLCAPCDESRSGGFSPDDGILLCQNHFASKVHQERTMVHEMIHMYDHNRFKVDWLNLRHHACSEACVKRRAVLSVIENPSCKDKEEAERAVASVFESCFADTRPFDEIY